MASLRVAAIRARHVSALRFCLPVVTALLMLPSVRSHAATDDTTLVSRQSDTAGGAAADRESSQPDISADGRYIAFASAAQNFGVPTTLGLQCGDLEGDGGAPTQTGTSGYDIHRIYVRDTVTGVTTLASRGDGLNGTPSNACSVRPSISANGRWVAFETRSAFSANDTNNRADIYLRDMVLGTTTLVSVDIHGVAPLGIAEWASVSDDGRYVAFNSDGEELIANDVGLLIGMQTYVRDMQAGTTVLASRASGVDGAYQDARSWGAEISGDGRHVIWRSTATNLATVSGCFNIFVRHLDTNTTELVSVQSDSAGGAPGDGTSSNPSISRDGRYVAFAAMADNLSNVDYDSNFTNASHCGIIEEEYGGDNDIFVRDLLNRTTTLVSRADGPRGAAASPVSTTLNFQGYAPSYRCQISAEGRFVTFLSASDNLSPDDRDDLGTDTNFETGLDVFVRDLLANRTQFVSRASGPTGAAGDAGTPRRVAASVSADGRRVAFASYATNLSAVDLDAEADVFARDLPDPDTISGSTLKLIDSPNPGSRRLIVSSKDAHIGVADRVAETGATLRVVGNGIDATYAMPAANWQKLANSVSYSDQASIGPVRKARIRLGSLSITGLGPLLDHPLASNPGPVKVVLTTDQRRYCMEFGGQVAYLPGKTYRAKKAPAPSACP